MELKRALVGQFRAGLAMLRECVAVCPEGLWGETVGEPPRAFWRIVYHTLFYTHLYLSPNEGKFRAWDRHVGHAIMTFAGDGEPLPPEEVVYSPGDLLEYLDSLSEGMDGVIGALDLDSPESGFPWYPEFPKIDHVLLTLRHLGVHVGQLQELLYGRGVEPGWVSRG